MRAALEIVNRMHADGVIKDFAIGGAVGATFYLEPSATLDVDFFVVLPATPSSSLISLSPIYEYLEKNGYMARGEHVIVGDWPVQFLTASNPLEQDAIAQALTAQVEGINTRVMSAEHLVAIALRTGRPKDHNRILQFLAEDAIDKKKLDQLLAGHGLSARWQNFRKRYLDE